MAPVTPGVFSFLPIKDVNVSELVKQDDGEELAPWEKMPGERSEAFHAFTHYRDLPSWNRSVRKAYQQHMHDCRGVDSTGKASPGTWNTWVRKFNWVERATKHDMDADKRQRNRNIFELNKARTKAADIANELLSKLKDDVDEYITGTISPDRLPAALKTTTELLINLLGADINKDDIELEEIVVRRYSHKQIDALHGQLPEQQKRKVVSGEEDGDIIEAEWNPA